MKGCPRESEVESSVKPLVTIFKTSHKLGEADQSKDIDEQRRALRRGLGAGRRPIGPIARHGDGAQVRVTKAQHLLARKPPDLQNLKRSPT